MDAGADTDHVKVVIPQGCLIV